MALVARARRDLLLRAHRHRLRLEDLEDAYSQATLELLTYARRGGVFASATHLGNVLEQRFLSRIHDRRRAISGRSPIQAALEHALPLGALGDEEIEIVDQRADLERIVMLRDDLSRIRLLAQRLSFDQRLVIAAQLDQVSRAEFCGQFGWTEEKYRKVAQRGRAKLAGLMEMGEGDVPQ